MFDLAFTFFEPVYPNLSGHEPLVFIFLKVQFVVCPGYFSRLLMTILIITPLNMLNGYNVCLRLSFPDHCYFTDTPEPHFLQALPLEQIGSEKRIHSLDDRLRTL